jgi:LemA protein
MKRQIVFILFIFLLIIVILGLGIYSNGMRHIRKLDETVQATWGDVEWRLEERGQMLPNFVEATKSYVSSQKKLFKTVIAETNELEAAIKEGDRKKMINLSNQLDRSLKDLLKATNSTSDLKPDENFLNMRKSLYDKEERIVSDKKQYNEAVVKFNEYLKGFPGRLITHNYSSQVLFQTYRNNEERDK